MAYLNRNGKELAIFGSRSLTDKTIVTTFLDRNRDRIKFLICNGVKGVHAIAQEWAETNGIPVILMNPKHYNDEGEYDRGGNMKCNYAIIDRADVCVCFYDGVSRGTRLVIEMAEELGKPMKIITFKPESPRVEVLSENVAAEAVPVAQESTTENPSENPSENPAENPKGEEPRIPEAIANSVFYEDPPKAGTVMAKVLELAKNTPPPAKEEENLDGSEVL